MSNSTLVLYHASCADGFGAAWAAWKKLGNEAVYVPVQYGQPYPPEIDGGVLEVFLLDFSYPADVLTRMKLAVERLVILDHHQTAEKPLQEFQSAPHGGYVDVRFDLRKSGAVLAWEYFHPGEPLPAILAYVQDRDLWTWALPQSREVSAALATYPFDFGKWSCLSQADLSSLAREGAAVLRYQQQQVERHLAHVVERIVAGEQGIPTVNATTLQSEIGEALCRQYPGAPFAATYFLRADGQRVWSLRSRGGFDVGALAKTQGGGGHHAAAGFCEASHDPTPR